MMCDWNRIYNSKHSLRVELIDKLFKNKSKIELENDIITQWLYLILKSVNYNPSIRYYSNVYTLIKNSDYDNTITNIIEKKTVYDYVYDLETVNSHFQAGVGEIIVHNTDSIFVSVDIEGNDPKKILQTAIDVGVEAGKKITESINRPPHNLEYEKTFSPFLLWKKKKYTGNLFEFDINEYIRKSMGDANKRRDYAPIAKFVYTKVINCLLDDLDIDKAVMTLISFIKEMFKNQFPIEQFIISKTLRSGYKNPGSVAHKVLADRVATRDPGNAFASNDRVPFIFIETNKKKKNKRPGDNIEIPEYVKYMDLKIDYVHYLRKQVMNPVCSVLSLIVDEPENIIEALIDEEIDKRNNSKGIGNWITIEAPIKEIKWNKKIKGEIQEEKEEKKEMDIMDFFS